MKNSNVIIALTDMCGKYKKIKMTWLSDKESLLTFKYDFYMCREYLS